MPWPSAKRIDDWNNVNARHHLGPILANYNTSNRLPYAPDALVAPHTTPWSKEDALSKLESSSSEGMIRPPRGDILSVAKVFMETTTDPDEKDIWERLVNSLAQLDAIAQSRALTPEEMKKKQDIIQDIADKSQGPLANEAKAKAPKPAPVTAIDIGAEIAKQMAVLMKAKAPSTPPSPGMSTPLKVKPGMSIKGKIIPGPPPGMKSSPGVKSSPGIPMPPLIPVIGDGKLGPPTMDEADVKIDSVANRANLRKILDAKYGTTLPPTKDREKWSFALNEFEVKSGVDNRKEFIYKPAKGTPINFPAFIMNVLNAYAKESEILIAYLIEPGTNNLDKLLYHSVPKDDIAAVTRASALGKFHFHPNYRLA